MKLSPAGMVAIMLGLALVLLVLVSLNADSDWESVSEHVTSVIGLLGLSGLVIAGIAYWRR